ncbi:MAG: c-type cytochrome domain-containing protein, partial [Aeoliella sp.]
MRRSPSRRSLSRLRVFGFVSEWRCQIFGLLLAAIAVPVQAELPAPLSFARDVRPILRAHCVGCHQPAKAGGEYVMTSYSSLRVSGDSGESPIAAGEPEESFLVDLITPHDGAADMPLGGEPLDDEQIATIARWIAEGAIDDSSAEAPQFDSEHPPRYTQPPVVTSLDYSPDGMLLAIAGNHEVRLHRADGTELIGRLIGLAERIETVRFSPDGKRLAVAGGVPALQGEVQIWDVQKQELVHSLMVGFDTARGVSWSPDGKQIAVGCSSDNSVRAFDTDTGEQLLYQSAPNDWPLDTVYSVDASHLVSVGRDMTAKLIEVGTQRFVDNITSITPGALKGGIHSVARHPLRDEILFGGADGVPRIYRMHRQTKRVIGDDANLLFELPPLEGRVFSVEFSADGTLIAAGSSLDGHGAVHVYRMQAEPTTPDDIRGLLFKPTHQRNKDEREKLKKHFADAVETVATVDVDRASIYSVTISPDGQNVAAAGSDGKVRIVRIESGKIASEFEVVEISDGPSPAIVSSAIDPTPDHESYDSIDEPPLPTNATVTRLVVEPKELRLGNTSAHAQLVVTAESSDGRTFDVTRRSQFVVDEKLAAISPTGLLRAVTPGDSMVTIKYRDITVDVPLTDSGDRGDTVVDYVQDVSPIIARAGCNAGTCHGAQDGKNGFKLSLRGYDPLFDVRALTDDHASRRVNLASPERSLMLLKATAQVPHEGGEAIARESHYYKTLAGWIKNGAKLEADSARVASVSVVPANPIVES